MKKNLFLMLLIIVLFISGSSVRAAEATKCSQKQPGGAWEYDHGKEYSINEINRSIEKIATRYGENNSTSDLKTDEIACEGIVQYGSIYDPRRTGKVSSVKNQGKWGLCWDYAAISTCESSMIAAGCENSSVDLSELHLAYFMFKESGQNVSFTDFCTKGYNSARAYLIMQNGIGPVSESTVPMKEISNTTTVDEIYKNRRLHQLQNIYYTDTDNVDAMKELIKKYGGLTVSYFSSMEYYRDNPTGNGDISFYNPNGQTTNHAVEIVGWDDNYSKENFAIRPSHNGAWLVKNSWGQRGYFTGEGTGYYWMSYEGAYSNAIAVSFAKERNETVTFNKNKLVCRIGNSVQLQATSTIQNQKIMFQSDNPSVASVSSTGVVTAKNYGKTTIYAYVDNNTHIRDVCTIYVDRPAFSLEQSSYFYLVGESFKLNPKVTSLSGTEYAIEYKSNNPKVATVDSVGNVKIVGEGNASIEMIAGGISDSKKQVSVTGFLPHINMKEESTCEHVPGKSVSIVVNFDALTSKYLSYKLEDHITVRVSDSNVIKAVKTHTTNSQIGFNVNLLKSGTATLIIEIKDASGKIIAEKSMAFVVKESLPTILVKETSYKKFVGETFQLEPTISSDGQTVYYPSYSSSNTNIATVDSKGCVKIVGPGNAKIQISTAGGAVKQNITIIGVSAMFHLQKEISYSPITTDMVENLYAQVDETTKSMLSNSIDKHFCFQVSNPNVISVKFLNVSGNKYRMEVHTLRQGTSDITVMLLDNNGNKLLEKTMHYEVTSAISKIGINNSVRLGCVGEEIVLNPIVSSSNGKKHLPMFSTTNAKVATVDSNGTVKIVGKGTANIIISISDSDVKATVPVVGFEPSLSIVKSKEYNTDLLIPQARVNYIIQFDDNTKQYLKEGNTKKISVIVSNTKIASAEVVSNNGNHSIWITAKTKGTTDITVMLANHDGIIIAKDSIKIEVVNPEEQNKKEDKKENENKKPSSNQGNTTNNKTNKTSNNSSKKDVGTFATMSSGKIQYSVCINGQAIIQKCDKAAKNVIIPDKVKANGKTYNVTGIAKNAFKGCKKLKTVTIKSKKITQIDAKAFSGCKQKITFKVPKAKKAAYKKMLKRKVTKYVIK